MRGATVVVAVASLASDVGVLTYRATGIGSPADGNGSVIGDGGGGGGSGAGRGDGDVACVSASATSCASTIGVEARDECDNGVAHATTCTSEANGIANECHSVSSSKSCSGSDSMHAWKSMESTTDPSASVCLTNCIVVGIDATTPLGVSKSDRCS